MRIYISSDHGGFEYKEKIINSLNQNKENEVVDLGPDKLLPDDDYPTYAFNLATQVSQYNNSLGILLCRSGHGMVIASNKVKGAYASLCFNEIHASKARIDDNINIICLPSDYIDINKMVSIVNSFINAQFDSNSERFLRRFKEVKDYERDHLN